MDAVKRCYLNNFPSALLALDSQVLNLHYEKMLAGGVPIAILYGDVQCGKSTIMETALALVGTSTSEELYQSAASPSMLSVHTWPGPGRCNGLYEGA